VLVVFVDYDGTLLTASRELSQGTSVALANAAAAEVTVVPASSRPLAGLQVGDFEPGASIALNGAVVRDAGAGALSEAKPIAPFDVGLCAELCEQFGLCFNLFASHEWLSADPADPLSRLERSRTGVEPLPLDGQHGFDEAHKLLLLGESNRLDACERRLAELRADQRLSWFRSDPRYLEINRRGVNKGRGVELLSASLGASGTVAIGDGDTDLPMFAAVDLAIAVGNATESVRTAADLVVAPNDSDGVAQALTEVLKGRLTPPRSDVER
jgi:Cof subfamily protein (haloacid dehalogenase superfamily)